MNRHPAKQWGAGITPVLLLSLVVSMLLLVASQRSIADHQTASSTQTSAVLRNGPAISVTRVGTVTVSHLPEGATNQPKSIAGVDLGLRLPMSSKAQADYKRQATHLKNLPALPARQPTILPGGAPGSIPAPNYQIAPQSRNFEGLNETQACGGGCQPPDQALATSSGFTLEGVNEAFSIYDYAGVLQQGPVSYYNFFAPIMQPGDGLSDPHLYYDSGTGRWISMIAEITISNGQIVGGFDDVAISLNGNPTGTWHLYQFSANVPGASQHGAGTWADFPQLGVDQAGLWLTGNLWDTGPCQCFDAASVWMLPKQSFWFGTAGTILNWYSVPGSLGVSAFTIAPAQELGTPQAEWMMTLGGGTLTLIAFTNTTSVNGGGRPTVSFTTATLPVPFAAPPNAVQPGSGQTVNTDSDVLTQVQYQGGHLLAAFTTGVNWQGDSQTRSGVYWLDITPQLTPLSAHTPQIVSGWLVNQANIFGFAGTYLFYPALVASSELDEALIFGYTNPGCATPGCYPSLGYTSRRATDAPAVMGQNNATWSYAIQGTVPTTNTRWGDYSAGSLSTYQPYQQDGVRGYIWLAGEYSGGAAFWQTRIFSLRTQ